MKALFLIILTILSIKADDKLPLHLLPHDCLVGQNAAKSMSHHGGGMKTAMYQLVGFQGYMKADAKYILSNLEQKDIKIKANMVNLPRSMYANYHALVANVEDKDRYFTAIYYLYKQGKPSNTSPVKLTEKQKGIFEIHPAPLPREHDRYYGSKTYQFILKFDNKPLANNMINLTTLNNTKQKIFTDKDGKFELTLPDDFIDVKVGRRANPPSYFILSSEIKKEDKTYYTTFTSPYNVNPTDYWSNIPAGFGVAGVGLLTGLFIYWRRKNG